MNFVPSEVSAHQDPRKSAPFESHAEELLNQMEEKFRILVEDSPLALAISERVPDGKVLYANKALKKLISEEVVGKPVRNFYANLEDRERVMSLLDVRGYIKNVEVELKADDGSRKWTLFNAYPIDYMGRPCLVSSVHDVSEVRQLTQALQDSQAMNSTIMATAPVGFYHMSPEGHVIYVNDKWLEIAGLKPGEALGHQAEATPF